MLRAAAGKYGVALTSTMARTRSGYRVATCSSVFAPMLMPIAATCVEPEMIEKRDDIRRALPERERPAWVRRASMAAEIRHDDAIAIRIGREHVPPVGANAEATVQQQQWGAVAACLVEHLEAVDRKRRHVAKPNAVSPNCKPLQAQVTGDAHLRYHRPS